MKISEIGEFGFIERVFKNFGKMVNQSITGIGDDCAVLPMDENYEQVVSTDMLIEDIHFLKNKTTPRELGYKSLAVNLSDIAAMGAKPTASFLSIAIPPDMEVEYIDDFMEGYRQLSRKYETPLLGGDTTKSSEKLVINVCIMGRIGKGLSRKRSYAKDGDIICVTGSLGDSAAGLKLMLDDKPESQTPENALIKWHNQPEPAVNEGIWLAKQTGVRAMMDVSDGIASDLKHILKASKTGAVINIDKLPLSHELIKTSDQYHWDPVNLALSGGEDYRLLITIDSNEFENISTRYKDYFVSPLSPIGFIENACKTGEIQWRKNGKKESLSPEGFSHFS